MPSPVHDPNELADNVARLVRIKVAKIVGNLGNSRLDTDDLEQQAMVRVLERLPRYDATRASLTTFLSRVVDSVLLDEERRRTAAKRAPTGGIRSLNRPTSNGEGKQCDLAQVVSRGDTPDLDGDGSRTPRELSNLSLDLKSELNSLPPHLQELLRRFLDNHGERPEGDISRGKWYRGLKAIQDRLQDSSLREYLI